MAQHSNGENYSPREIVAGIGSYAAAALLAVAAVVTILQGISALASDQAIVVVPGYVYEFNSTSWGWIHIIVGILVGAVALGLFFSTTWARVAAIIIASLSIVTQFLWLPHYPVWAIVVIALDIFVIWAVATWESPAARVEREQERAHALNALAPQPMFGGQLIRLEDGMNDGRYEIRAELPGINPDRDVDVTVRDGVLTIRAQRRENAKPDGRSEFAYGSFVRSIPLPPGANQQDVHITYRDGILTISVGVPQAAPAEKRAGVS
ncbi:MAG TPA: Hsp20 family protein [Mycobacterium sp.]|nr:Hsp20 family protein [Mycobacterium sp.]HTX93962.1 Hsp20 family protein [Mycobacterium sp.]